MRSVFPATKLVAPESVSDEEVIHKEFGRRMFRQNFRFSPSKEYPDGIVPFVQFGASGKPVYILPVTRAREIVLVREFRPAVGPRGSFVISNPGGNPKPGQSVMDVVRAELEEETGYRAEGEIIQLTNSLITNLSFRMESVTVLALDCVKVREPHPDPTEVMEVLTCSVGQLLMAVMSGEVRDGQLMSLLLLALPHLGWLSRNLLPE